MSDFFESKYQRPVFSPVIKITKSNNKPQFVSDIGQTSKETMFDEAKKVQKLMKEQNLSLMNTAKILSLDSVQVANKLRLLEFGQAECESLVRNGYGEKEALLFLQLDKTSRLYAMEYCRQEEFDENQIEQYINNIVEESKQKNRAVSEVKDIGFLENSLKKILSLAEKMGFEVSFEAVDDKDYRNINIRVKKKHVDNL
ncbi:MAG: hypothetical protein J6K12_04930 [Clostridia bacterium]|nr:hypothetical protein [Clostridia bacterium]